MGDTRFEPPYERVRSSRQRANTIRSLEDDEVIAALAASAKHSDALLANVLATEAMNRMQRSRIVATHLGEGVYALDRDGCITFVNPAATRLVGYSEQEMIGRSMHELVHFQTVDGKPYPEDECPILGTLRDDGIYVSTNGEVFTRKDGSTFPVALTATPVRREGEIQGVVIIFRDLSRDEASAEALRQGEERYRSLYDLNPNPVFTIDDHGRFVGLNRAAEALTGYPADELVGQAFAPLLGPEDLVDALARLQRVLQGHREEADYTLIRKDGGRRRISVTAVPITERGRIVGMHGIARDVTEQHRLQRELHHGEQTHRMLVESVQDYAIFMLDPQGHIITWNRGAQRLNGYTADEIIGKHFRILYPAPEQQRKHPEHELQLATENGSYEEEGWRIRKDGSRFWAHVTITALRDEEGQIRGFGKVTRDLTEQRHAQEQEARLHRQHAAVAELGLKALQTTDPQALMEAAVNVLAEHLGVEYAKVLELLPDRQSLLLKVGIGWREGLVGNATLDTQRDSQAGYTLLHEGPVVVRDLQNETRFHGPQLLVDHEVRSGMSTLIHGMQAPYGILGVHTKTEREFTPDDIAFLQSVANVLSYAVSRAQTEQSLERRIQERTTSLENAVKDLQTFTNSVSHDLRAPLRGLEELVRALREDHEKELSEEGQRLLTMVHSESRRATRLVHDLLSFARSGQKQIERREIDLSELAREVAGDIDAAHPEYRTRWRIQDGLRTRADPGLTRTLLHTLFDNAAKYSSRAPQPEVRLDTVQREGRTKFRVRDNGVGFDASEAYRLFQPFSRLRSASGFEGTGLGLATVSRIVGRHGGTIEAHSNPGEGAEFLFTLEDAQRNE